MLSRVPNFSSNAEPRNEHSPPSDGEVLAWLAEYAKGHSQGARRLVQYFLPRLHRLAYRLLHDAGEAEDVCQEVFMKLWQLAPRWQPEAQVGTWLHQVALNAARDRLRKRRDVHADVRMLNEIADTSLQADPERSTAKHQSDSWLANAIAALPARQREALLLVHDQQLSQREAAAVMDIEVGALESLLSRARQALRQAAQAREAAHEE